MSKPVAVLMGLAMSGWLVSMTWLVGYRSGYDDGSNRAWETARASLAPHLVNDGTAELAAGAPQHEDAAVR